VKLSVLVPVFNERQTILPLIDRVCRADAGMAKEVLVADDGSTDGTRDLLAGVTHPDVRVLMLDRNIGRGGVIKHLWTVATGDIYLHQDADLEYDPAEYDRLVEPIVAGRADVVLGSRFLGTIAGMRAANRAGNLLMSATYRMLYGVAVTDLMTCYKVYRGDLVRGVRIDANGFDFEAEFLSRLAQRGARFAEVPVSFVGRTVEEGKKIRAFDAVRVMRRLLHCKLSGPSHA
jgi:glycosyltransferase involved in cell wall biosynthesis